MTREELLGSESIILGLGDLKLSDTYRTFGDENRCVNGISYKPIKVAREWWQISDALAMGDTRKGIAISDGKTEIYLTYGANTIASYAQSFAIGYKGRKNFFFIIEYFKGNSIYTATPQVASRRIVKCQSLDVDYEDTKISTIFDYILPNHCKLSKRAEQQAYLLDSRIQRLSRAFCSDNLEELRTEKRYRP